MRSNTHAATPCRWGRRLRLPRLFLRAADPYLKGAALSAPLFLAELTAVAQPRTFGVADVHISPHTPWPCVRGGLTTRGSCERHSASIAGLLSIASNTWAICVINPQGPARPEKKTAVPWTQPEIRLNALTASVKLDPTAGKAEIKKEGEAMKKAALHVRLGYDDRHSVVIGPPGSTTEIDADLAYGTQTLLYRIQGADKTPGLAATVYNCADFASNPEILEPAHCRFQGNNQKPLEKLANQDDQVGLGLAARRALAKKAVPVKIEGVQAVGALAAGASINESVHVHLTSKKAARTPVAVTELYDLGAEENAEEFVIKMYPFDPTHSRPIALGLDIEPLPPPVK